MVVEVVPGRVPRRGVMPDASDPHFGPPPAGSGFTNRASADSAVPPNLRFGIGIAMMIGVNSLRVNSVSIVAHLGLGDHAADDQVSTEAGGVAPARSSIPLCEALLQKSHLAGLR